MSTWRTVVGVGLMWVLAAPAASAQEVAGSQVSGVVRDSSGGVLPGVEVTLTKTDTGATRTYALVVPPGSANLRFELAGGYRS